MKNVEFVFRFTKSQNVQNKENVKNGHSYFKSTIAILLFISTFLFLVKNTMQLNGYMQYFHDATTTTATIIAMGVTSKNETTTKQEKSTSLLLTNQQQQQDKDDDSDDVLEWPPLEYNDGNHKIGIEPVFGEHHHDADAIFAMAMGYDFGKLFLFLASLAETNFTGDVILGLDPKDAEKPDFIPAKFLSAIRYNIILYSIKGCVPHGMYPICIMKEVYYKDNNKATTNEWLEDKQKPRFPHNIRFEYYWIWSRRYSATSRIFVSDSRDVYFQDNPFDFDDRDTFHAYEEPRTLTIGEEKFNGNWILSMYPNNYDEIKDHWISCSGTSAGGHIAMETYFLAMLHEIAMTPTTERPIDQGNHNYLIYVDRFQGKGVPIKIHPDREGAVHTHHSKLPNNLETSIKNGFNPADNKVYRTDNTTLVPVVHQYDRSGDLKGVARKMFVQLSEKYPTQ